LWGRPILKDYFVLRVTKGFYLSCFVRQPCHFAPSAVSIPSKFLVHIAALSLRRRAERRLGRYAQAAGLQTLRKRNGASSVTDRSTDLLDSDLIREIGVGVVCLVASMFVFGLLRLV